MRWFGIQTMLPFRQFLAAGWLCFLGCGEGVRGGEYPDVEVSYGTVTTLAGVPHTVTTNPDGTGINFWLSDYEGTAAKHVSLSNPHIAAADAFGNTYIADKASHAILKVSSDGLIHTFAGTHEPGFNGDGPAPARTLQISFPNGLFVFPDGTVYLLDPGNHRIRKVDRAGIMTTVVNDPDPSWMPSGRALWVSPDESLIYYSHEYPPIPPSSVASGAVIKQWTRLRGIETVCSVDVGFRNPANLAVNPVDGKLWVTDRAEEDLTKLETGLYRIDGVNLRTRMTGDVNEPKASTGQEALHSFIEQPRGIAFLADGSYFLCAHKDGNVWYVDVHGILHRYVQGSGKGDTYLINDGDRPPLNSKNVISQPRAVTIAPNGDLLVVSNDSGYLFRVRQIAPPVLPTDLRVTSVGADGVRLQFTGEFGRGYRVERASSIGAPDWDSLGAVSGAPVGSVSMFQDLPPGMASAAFYRLLPAQ